MVESRFHMTLIKKKHLKKYFSGMVESPVGALASKDTGCRSNARLKWSVCPFFIIHHRDQHHRQGATTTTFATIISTTITATNITTATITTTITIALTSTTTIIIVDNRSRSVEITTRSSPLLALEGSPFIDLNLILNLNWQVHHKLKFKLNLNLQVYHKLEFSI